MGFRDERTLLMPLGEMHGIGPGSTVRATGSHGDIEKAIARWCQCCSKLVDDDQRPGKGWFEPVAGSVRRHLTSKAPVILGGQPFTITRSLV